jgi:hypothetical protein
MSIFRQECEGICFWEYFGELTVYTPPCELAGETQVDLEPELLVCSSVTVNLSLPTSVSSSQTLSWEMFAKISNLKLQFKNFYSFKYLN